MEQTDKIVQFRRRPRYSVYIQARIARAREKARAIPRRAWVVGRSQTTGARQFMVISSRGPHSYYPAAFDHPRRGGYCYAHDGEPLYWIVCDCDSYATHNKPCWHAARVQLRLAREEARNNAQRTGDRDGNGDGLAG